MASGAYREIGEFETAEKYLKEAYVVVATQAGEESVQCAAILSSMGMLYKYCQHTIYCVCNIGR